MNHRLMGTPVQPMANSLMPLGHAQHLLMSALLVYAPFNPGHASLLITAGMLHKQPPLTIVRGGFFGVYSPGMSSISIHKEARALASVRPPD